MPTLIVAERADTQDATTLIKELDGQLGPLYPQESRRQRSRRYFSILPAFPKKIGRSQKPLASP
jgi:hypothetical protein